MKTIASLLLACVIVSVAEAQPTTFTLNGLPSFGARGDGSIQPGDSIGISPMTGFEIFIGAPGVTNAWLPGETSQDTRTTGSTNGYNMRGLTYDPVSGNLVFVDTHEGSGGTVSGAERYT